ncbi:MAG: AzlC family ABC transporter permease [Gammaproteobacteria bacterium]|nr:AzlC family ABC transporter permease [Gammaproteobacteria bacterium]
MIDHPKPACIRAVKDALGFPSIMLCASMMGFGSLAQQSGYSLGMALSLTAGIWGLPGQVAMIEFHASGASILFAVLASSLANARFMPMAVSFLPLIRDGVRHYGWMFVLVQMLSLNPWAAGQRVFPGIITSVRVYYYVVFALVCMAAGLTGTAIGYFGIGNIGRPAALGLLFLNPLFFSVMIAGTRMRPAMIAILIGIPLGPIFHYLSSDWGLLAAGLIGGSFAFWIHRKTKKEA